MPRQQKEKPEFAKRHQALLAQRYDLADRAAPGITMSRGKPMQEGVRVRLSEGMTWEKLAEMTPEQIHEQGAWPDGFLPLPHPHHEAGGMVFPKFLIDETLKQTGRDLTRFDLDFDLPDHVLPEFPAPIYITTRPDLGDVSKGRLVTQQNFEELFSPFLNPKQLDGMRLLVTPFPQQQFNMTADRRSAKPSQGVACFDCHANGHTNAATHTVGDSRPNEHRHRIDTSTLRGVNVQRLFGSQRALKTVEDFTEFEQCAACHTPPYYTDNLMHNLKVERFFTEKMINGRFASADGPIKTFPLRGIKDSPPYLHDDRLITLDDTVEFFNLVLELKLAETEKKDLVAFLRAL